MMSQKSDRELLARYVRFADHDAFTELVRRHVAMVHAAAMRQTRDAALADDVTQAVMIVLARKAGTIASDSVLPSWLFTVTRHAAQNALKIRARQRIHEHYAATLRSERVEPVDPADDELKHALDEAIARLPELERGGILLHYFQDRSHSEIGVALGLSPEAARKRIQRALEKMRIFMSGRGVVATETALVALMKSEAAAASISAGLLESTINIAIITAGGGAQVGAGSLAIAAGVTRMIALAKIKVAATIALAIVGVAGAAAWPLVGLANRTFTAITSTTLLESSDPATQPADSRFVTNVNKDVKIEFLGVSPYPGDESSWFSIAGEPIEMPDPTLVEQNVVTDTEPEHQLVMRIHRPRGTVIAFYVEGAMLASNSHADADAEESYLLISRFRLQQPSDSVAVRLGIASAEWQTIASSDDAQQQADIDAGKYGMIMILPAERDDLMGGTKVQAHHSTLELPNRLVAIDDQGKEHISHNVNVNNTNGESVTSYSFDLPIDKVRKVRLEVREFDKFVEARDITLSVDHKTTPQIKITDAESGR